ncbi:16S rRNA (cytosine(967)-C(5))-methyltransferase RsmB [Ligilactobacillus sp. LYQ60]|uniref:16S rRNA (cytosine(967)-C(5))-methyltransferase RsmB n=1 Tax=unclassified Ligilactobacillus TaxID=2767920 RepID=UPI00385506BC
MQINETPRYLVVDMLDRVMRQHAYSNLTLNQVLSHHPLTQKDQRLLTQLFNGVLQHRLTLEYWLTPFIRGKQLVPWVNELLLSALYQMHYLDRIPDRAVFSETIEIAKRRGHAGIRRFVTGVLHAVQRQGVRPLSVIADPVKKLSITASVPQWLVQQLIAEHGFPRIERMLATINDPPVQSVRVVHPATRVRVVEALRRAGLAVTPSPITPVGLRVTGGFVPATAAFKQGLITVQDESAQLAVDALMVRPADQVLDACAAPGGKTTQIAGNLTTGRVTALDLHAHKIKLIKQNATRCGVAARVNARQLDARRAATTFTPGCFDRILVDAPCSGIGLLRRKPEIRYMKTAADSKQLHAIQGAILDAVAPTLRVGGRLVYSTCTILQQENEKTVTAFLARHPEYTLERVQTTKGIKTDRGTDSLTIYPDDFMTDGFFIAALRRIK